MAALRRGVVKELFQQFNDDIRAVRRGNVRASQ
jgi:hypothetical protein